MKLFGIDMHVATRQDHRVIFRDLGHEFHSHSISNHAWVVGESPARMSVDVEASLPNLFTSDVAKRFQDSWERYWTDTGIECFVVSYCPSMARLYAGTGIPTIIHIPIRYEYPWTHDRENWERFNQFLRDGIDSHMIYVVANNLFDRVYFEGYVGRPCRYISSLCSYFPKAPLERDGWLSWGKSEVQMRGVKPKSVLGGRYNWNELIKYKGVAWVPYQVSVMSMFEQYWSGMTVLVPTRSKLMKMYEQGHGLEQYSWAKMAGRKAALEWPKNSMPDPNDYQNLGSVSEWLNLADYYNGELSAVDYWDSLAELDARLIGAHNRMRQENTNTERFLYVNRAWKKLFDEIREDHGRET